MMSQGLKYMIKTFGCQMNVSDSERVITILEALGFEKTDSEEKADLVLFNTCSVKQKAEDKVFGAIKDTAKLKKKKPGMLIGITGCMVRQTGLKADAKADAVLPKWRKDRARELKKMGLKANKGVDSLLKRLKPLDFVFRVEDIAKLGELLMEANPSFELPVLADEGTLENYFKIAPQIESAVQAYVPVMTGCDKFCTYCIVPFTRGREYSRDFSEIMNEAEKLVKGGTKEITLVGQTVNTYGLSRMDRASGKFKWYYDVGGQISSAYRSGVADTSGVEKPFVKLLKSVDALKDLGLKRLRYTSPHPRDFTDDVIDALASLSTICPHIHMPVQSGSDSVLRRMNRNYTLSEYRTIMEKMRARIPNLSITTDIIVGFCSETDEEFEETYRMYDELEWDFCYLSQYSPRKGTVAEKMMEDDIPQEVKKRRWHRMNELMRSKVAQKNTKYFGKVVEVLVEKVKKSKDGGFECSGRTPDFKEVFIKSGKNMKGQFVEVKITKTLEWVLEGELI